MGWVEGPELFADPGPLATAMQLVDQTAWDNLEATVNCAGVFVNAGAGEMHVNTSWEQICLDYGYTIYPEDLAIPMGLEADVRAALIELRDMLHAQGDDNTGGCKAFRADDDPCGAWAEIHHDGGGLAPYFNWSYERPGLVAKAEEIFIRRGMWLEALSQVLTVVWRTEEQES